MLVIPTEKEIGDFHCEIYRYNESMTVSNNFLIRFKALVEDFNLLIEDRIKNKKDCENSYDISKAIDSGLERLRIPAKVYVNNGYFEMIVKSDVDILG